MQIVVNEYNFSDYLLDIQSSRYVSIDTETTGTRAYNGDKLFCVTVSTIDDDYYFDFNEEQDNDSLLDRSYIPKLMGNFTGTLFAHNAKFDMHFLMKEGLDLRPYDIHCTEAIGRLVDNCLFNYSLASLTGQKSDEVKEYISQHKLYREENGKKIPCYNLVPFEIIMPYALNDTHITLRLGMQQIESLHKQASELANVSSKYSLLTLLEKEMQVTKVLFNMEFKGVNIDLAYAQEAHDYEVANYKNIAKLFEEWCGIPFEDKKPVLVKAFNAAGERVPMTPKGNPCLNAEALDKMDSPLAIMVKDWRRAYKMAHTYYQNFLYFADEDGIIHPNFQQGGAKTGRLSCREPNMQNCPKKGEDTSKFPVRKCFIPPKGYLWFSFDWKAMEYRLMLDYAGEKTLIAKVAAGHDVHQATADLIGLVRGIAKNVNFALLYGTGDGLLSHMIKKPLGKTKAIRQKYFSKLPSVKVFIQKVIRTIKTRGYVVTCFGRKLRVFSKDHSYAGPNYLIQGGCADIMKYALVEIDALLEGKKSFMSLTVHDEADIMMHPSELYLVEKIESIMSNVYEQTSLKMAVDVEYSEKNWTELKEFVNAA